MNVPPKKKTIGLKLHLWFKVIVFINVRNKCINSEHTTIKKNVKNNKWGPHWWCRIIRLWWYTLYLFLLYMPQSWNRQWWWSEEPCLSRVSSHPWREGEEGIQNQKKVTIFRDGSVQGESERSHTSFGVKWVHWGKFYH